MTCADLLTAETVCFGDFKRLLTLRYTPGGADRLNDLAQAWIDGDRERVIAHALEHDRRVRSRMQSIDPSPDTVREKIRALRREGCSTKTITQKLNVTPRYVARVTEDLPSPPRETRKKTDTKKILLLRSEGLSPPQIAREIGVDRTTVWRILKSTPESTLEEQSSKSATN